MKTKVKFSKKAKIWTCIASAFCVIALAIGLPLGLVDFSPKTEPVNVDNVGGAPENSGTWTDNASQVDLNWAGSGTQADPWQIKTAKQLAGLSYSIQNPDANTPLIDSKYYYANKYFKLMNDIDLSKYYWTPIGTQEGMGDSIFNAKYFSGTFDGGDHKISGVYVNRYDGGVGLFGIVSGIPGSPLVTARIKSVVLESGRVDNGNYYVGGIVGYANTVTYVENCINKAYIGNSSGCGYVGGIVGGAGGIEIYNCSNYGKVENGPAINLGGIIGGVTMIMNINNCFNAGELVTSGDCVGGIVGRVNGATMHNCYNKGKITGYMSTRVGGILGTGYIEASNCYNVGQFADAQPTMPMEYCGQIIGEATSSTSANFYKCYYVSGKGVGSGTVRTQPTAKSDLTTAARTASFYTTESNWNSGASIQWDFTNTWMFSTENDGYPVLMNSTNSPKNKAYWDEDVSRLDTDWDGAGTYADPYLITSAAELAGLAYMVNNGLGENEVDVPAFTGIPTKGYYSNKYFKQTCDIDLSDYYWNMIGSGIPPYRAFSGSYDGNGNTISGLFINYAANGKGWMGGLFGLVSGQTGGAGATIQKLAITDSYIYTNTGGAFVGTIEGNVTMQYCYSTADVRSAGANVGGLIGTTIGDYTINIWGCYNAGNVSYFGTNTYASVGGLIGSAGPQTYVMDCFNVGEVVGVNLDKTGSLAGSSTDYAISNCFYISGTSIGSGSGDCTLTTLENLRKQSYYENKMAMWGDFTNTWQISASVNDGLPTLRKKTIWSGTGDENSPYLVKYPAHLKALADEVNAGTNLSGKYFKQVANIDLADYDWTPIGTERNPFQGRYYGGGYKISGLNIDSAERYQGLFGSNQNARLFDITISDSYIKATGKTFVGAIAGNHIGGIIQNCKTESNVRVEGGDCVGGIVGDMAGGFLNNINHANVIGSKYVGGIVGEFVRAGNIQNCYNYGDVKGSSYVAGIVGLVVIDTSWAVSNCHSNGIIEGESIVASIATTTGKGATIQNCSANGRIISQDTAKAAALVYRDKGTSTSESTTITNCSFVGTSSAKNLSLVDSDLTDANFTIDSCYSVVNSKKTYTSGDFSGFGLVSGMNDDLPMQRALYYMAEMSPATGEEVIARLQQKGFKQQA